MIQNGHLTPDDNCVFLGFMYDEEKERELLQVSKSGIQAPINQYQWGFIEGLQHTIPMISIQPLPVFSGKCRKWVVKRQEKETSRGKITYLPFLNFAVLRDRMQDRRVRRELERYILSDKPLRVYVYSLYLPFMRAMKALKRKYGDRIEFCLIITDIPGKYGIMRKKYSLRGIKDRIEAKPRMELAAYCDCYVFLTEAMKDLFPPKPYWVAEGFLPQKKFDYAQSRVPGSVLYTGSLNAAYGIQKLVRGMQMIDDRDWELWICGAGDSREYIEQAAKEDGRIKYLGFLSKEEVTKLQTKCDILVNPRSGEGLYTKYSFPSKTMEYLLSGSKVVMCRLDGIGDEYYEFIRTLKDTKEETFRDTLRLAIDDRDFYKDRWQKQVQWINEHKSADSQVRKLFEQ